MKTRIECKYSAGLLDVIEEDNHVFQGSVATTEFHLFMDNEDKSQDWLPTDGVFICLTRSDGKSSGALKMNLDQEGGWIYISNGWLEDVDLGGEEGTYKVSFLMRRYSTLDGKTLISTKTSEEKTLPISPSVGWVPQDIDLSVYEQVIQAISNQDEKIDELVNDQNKVIDKLENFQIGTVTAKASESGAQPQVTAEIINQSTPNRYLLDMNFTLPRGEQGEKGDKGDPGSIPPSDEIPLMDGVGSSGTLSQYARGDHRHPSDTGKVSKSGDTMTGDLSIEKTGAMITATDGTQAVALHMGSGGVNRGVFDKTNSKWLFYADTTDGSSLLLNANTNVKGELKENGTRVYSPNNLPPVGYNMLINPDSAINQRGIYTSTSTGYMSDRWYKILGQYARVDIENGTYTLTAVKNLASGTWSRCFTQMIECPKALWGEQVTFSLNVLIALSRSYIRMQIHALNANKGTIQASPASQGLDRLGIVYESFTVPENTVYLQVNITMNIGTIPIGSMVKFDSPKLEHGTTPTPFYVPNIAEEMPKCMRYYYRIAAGSDNQPAIGIGQANTASMVISSGLLPIEMRVTPTAKLTGTINIRSGNSYGTASTFTAFNSPCSFQLQIPNSVNLTTGNCADLFLNQNSILEFDAEI